MTPITPPGGAHSDDAATGVWRENAEKKLNEVANILEVWAEEPWEAEVHKHVVYAWAMLRDHREAENQQLREALEKAVDVAQWMSGSESFSPGGEAHEGWLKQRERLFEAMEALAGAAE